MRTAETDWKNEVATIYTFVASSRRPPSLPHRQTQTSAATTAANAEPPPLAPTLPLSMLPAAWRLFLQRRSQLDMMADPSP